LGNLSFHSNDFPELDKYYRRNLINSLTGYKSVSLVGTQNEAGKTNLAIFSQIIHVGASPPLIGILFRPHVVPRHTLENILNTGYYTINHIPSSHAREAHHTSARWETSEFEACGFTPEYTDHPAPYVKESPLHIGLQLEKSYPIDLNDTVLVVGKIVELILPDESVGSDGFIDLTKTNSVTCAGLDAYYTANKIARYTYAKPDRAPGEIE
jgi:flavin reductase (DIM6/NTAB) family NADH-FMN oxidoreductase RutF